MVVTEGCLMCVSGEAEFSSHHSEAKQLSLSLCYFTAKKMELTTPPQTNATKELIIHYVKVVEGHSPRHSVDSLLYTTGNEISQ